MSKHVMRHCAVMVALALCANAAAQTTTDPSTTSSATTPATTGQTLVAGKVAHPFVTLAGSQENAVALANALRTGTPATLTYASTDANGQPTTTTTTITPPTKPMGWGNVSHSLALTQFALNQAGIANPTSAELQAALQGNSITTADGKTVTFAGVLQQRADGMGWGRIAQSYGTTMGAVNRSIKAPTTAIAATTTNTPTSKTTTTVNASKVTTSTGITTADGARVSAPSRGLTTAGGTSAGSGHGGKGLTTAAGATGSSSTGVTTGKGGAGIVTADPGHGAGSASGHGKGKGGG
ncbi:MAG TPA: hypothetical protein VEO36_04725 [Casimicrobiaceae bacterium]|nr:hypothetical protein [Casimicrobiaceae bacterium]